jgi:hypothetical protein
MGAKVFVSYSSKDSDLAQRLVSALLLNGLSVWFDQFDLDTGDPVYRKIEQGVIGIDYLALVLTTNSVGSAWVTEEFTLARQRELEERRMIILPLLFAPVELPLNLRARKVADFRDFDHGFAQLMRSLERNVVTPELDASIRRRVKEVLVSGAGGEAVSSGQVLRSQNAARLSRAVAVNPGSAERALNEQPEARASIRVNLVIHAAQARIPFAADPDERCDHVLARVLRALGLDGALSGQRISFFLVHDGLPLEVDETLREADVDEGAELELGLYTFLIE